MARAALILCAVILAVQPAHAQGPWLAVDARVEEDTQDRTGLVIGARYGQYWTPEVTLALDLTLARISGPAEGPSLGSTAASGATPSLSTATARAGLVATFALPGARLGVDAVGHVLIGPPGAGATPLFDRVEVALDRAAAPGWAGEAAYRRESYGDGNPVTSA